MLSAAEERRKKQDGPGLLVQAYMHAYADGPFCWASLEPFGIYCFDWRRRKKTNKQKTGAPGSWRIFWIPARI